MIDATILIGSFSFGGLAIIVTLLEIRMLYSFINDSQSMEDVPIISNKENDQLKNEKIRAFRRFLLSNKSKNKAHLIIIRKKMILLNIISLAGFILFSLGIAFLYFTR